MIKSVIKAAAVGAVMLGTTAVAQAGVILDAVSVTTSSTLDHPWITPNNMSNESGLMVDFQSGVTDFDDYFAQNPTHRVGFGYEWFADYYEYESWAVFDLGAIYDLSRLAIWNEESWGVSTFDVSFSVDNSVFENAINGLGLTDHPVADYTADLFRFDTVSARYVRLDLHDCGGYGCSLGEVVFGTGEPAANVAAPGGLALMGLGLLGLALYRRRQA